MEEPEPDPGASIEKTIAAPTQVEWSVVETGGIPEIFRIIELVGGLKNTFVSSEFDEDPK